MILKKVLLPVLIGLLLVALSLFAWRAYVTKGSESTLHIQLDENKAVMESNGFSFKLIDSKTRNGVQAVDIEHTYDVMERLFKVGELTVTTRKLNNGDQFIFNRFVNTRSTETTLPLEIRFTNADSYDFFDFNDEEPVREHHKTYGVDYTTNMKGLYTLKEKEATEYELLLSQNYISKELVENLS